MRTYRRFLLLFAVAALFLLWPGGLDGWAAFWVRLLVLVTAALVALNWTAAPWGELQSACERLSRGDFSARLDDVTPGALAAPAHAFNRMAEELAHSLGLSKEREERLVAVLAASDRGILVVRSDGAVLLTSEVTQQLFPRFQREVGLPSLGLPGLTQLAEDSLSSGESRAALIEEGERGEQRTFSARITPLNRDEAVIYLRDVTDESRLARVKADLVANVSHELRTPLTVLSSLTETLSDPELSPGRRAHFIERLQFQIGRMQNLVDDLLTLSRLESEKEERRTEEIAVAPFCRDLTSGLLPFAEQTGITIRARCPEELVIRAERNLLEAAVGNLLDNAIRYNRPNGTVTLSVAADGEWVRFSVQDTGEGIPRAHLARIFERFYRVDTHRSREKGGTGLGLAIVKHAAGRLGAEVRVESTVGTGSTFTLTLPAKVPPPEGREPQHEAAPEHE
jgi:two-component system phosphate regulon sensor histidine kinase PhoR